MSLFLSATVLDDEQGLYGLLLDVVVRDHHVILKLDVLEDQSLLRFWDAFCDLDLCFDRGNGVAGLHVDSDCLACEVAVKDLHSNNKEKIRTDTMGLSQQKS